MTFNFPDIEEIGFRLRNARRIEDIKGDKPSK